MWHMTQEKILTFCVYFDCVKIIFNKVKYMDTFAGILLVLTAFAFGVFVSIKLSENEKKYYERKNEKLHRKQQKERINKLVGRS